MLTFLCFSLISLEGSNPASKQAIAAKVGQKIITKVAAGASPVASGSVVSGSNVVSGTAATSVTVTSPTAVTQPQPQQIQVQPQQVQIQPQQQAAPVVVSSPTVTQQIVNKSPSIVVRNQAGQPIKQIIQKQVVQKVSLRNWLGS